MVTRWPQRLHRRLVAALLTGIASASCLTQAAGTTPSAATPSDYRIPVEYYKLGNGLKVAFSVDRTLPIVAVAVYYQVGFRLEPRNRTGFAHLFEHMMFQGSRHLGKAEWFKLVQANGGVVNGSTRYDFTNYWQVVPSHKLQTMLWGEADRMGGLQITEENLRNQQSVVSNEVKVVVLNRPYGGFPWLDMPQYANVNWHNAHDFYGDLQHIEAATVAEVQAFFDTYYAPNNAALSIVGDFDPVEARRWVEQYFGAIPARKLAAPADLTEPRQEKEKRASKVDARAQRPALAFAYHMPPRNTPEYYAMGLLDRLLLDGEDSLLHQELVNRRGYTSAVEGGINLLGNMFNYIGPTLWTGSLYHDSSVPAQEILQAVDAVIERLRAEPLDEASLERALVKIRAHLYGQMDSPLFRSMLLACLVLFDDDPHRINSLEQQFRQVTPALMLKTAREYLRPTNRTVLMIEPAEPAVTKARSGR